MADEPQDDQTKSFVSLSAGTLVSHYKIISMIGAGGMGEVYLAEDTQLDRKVALKFLPPHLCQDEDCRKRFKREAQAAAKLSHPNIITIHEVSEYQGRPFFAMEHVEGRSLKEHTSGRDLAIEQILELAIQICSGLHAAHEKGVTHRDIKPSNILIDSHGRARIVDFGLASVRDADQLTKTGSTMGTVGYMSPEQVQGKEVDHRSDLFSLGVVLYELITKQNPFRRESEAATMRAVSDDHPEPLARFKRDIPEGMQAVIDKALEKDVSTRYQHGDGMCSDLMRVKRSLESTQTSVPSVAHKKKASHIWWIAAAVVIIIAVILFVTKPWVSETVSDRPEKILLAVLPFENLGDPADEYFADGIAEEIRVKLTGIKSFRITSRTSAMQYKNTEKSLKQIGRELGVDYVLEGTIRWDKSADVQRVRVTPQLIQVADDAHLWADTYERPLTEVFKVQADIATRIAGAMGVSLLPPERSTVEKQPTDNIDAYNFYLRARRLFWESRVMADVEESIRLYKRAVELDSTFTRAISELSYAYSYQYWMSVEMKPEVLGMAKLTADLALSQAPDDAYTHLAQGYYYYYGHRDYRRAEGEFKLALSEMPGDSWVLSALGYIKRRLGQWDESYELQKRAVELDPLAITIWNGLMETAGYMRRFDDMEAGTGRMMQLWPDNLTAYVYRARLHLDRDGDPQQALQLLDSLPPEMRSQVPGLYMFYHAWSGEYQGALADNDYWLDERATNQADTAHYYINKAFFLWNLDRIEESRLYYDSARLLLEPLYHPDRPRGAYLLPALSDVYARLGRSDDAVRLALEEVGRIPLEEDAILGADVLERLAIVYSLVGEHDKAIDCLDTLLSIPSEFTPAKLRLDPDFDPLRDHPRFKELLEKYEKIHGT